MSATWILMFLVSQVSSLTNNMHRAAPPEARETSYSISSEASARIDPLDGRSLANDQEFVRVLTEVLNSEDLEEADKADAFFLMRMKFDWAFVGAVACPPGYGYDRTLGMFLQTYRGYQAALQRDYDVTGLLELAKLPEPENIVRASSGLHTQDLGWL